MVPEKQPPEKAVCILLTSGENPEDNPIFAYVAVRGDKPDDCIEVQRGSLPGRQACIWSGSARAGYEA